MAFGLQLYATLDAAFWRLRRVVRIKRFAQQNLGAGGIHLRRASPIPLGVERAQHAKSKKKSACFASALLFGDPSEARTPDTLLKRQVLCQLS